MKAGKSMKAAARSWRGGKSKPRRKATPKTKRRSIRSRVTGGRKVARGGFNSQKMFKLLRMAALVAPAAADFVKYDRPYDKARYILKHYTGYDIYTQRFELGDLAGGYAPYVGAILATYGIPKLAGIIRGI